MTDEKRQPVEVPEDFRRIGFSGLFWLEVPMADDGEMNPDLVAKLPQFAPHSGDKWILLSHDAATRTSIIVRRDDVALVEAFTTPRAS